MFKVSKSSRSFKVAIRHCQILILGSTFVLATLLAPLTSKFTAPTQAIRCPDLKIIFVRGSGAERYNNEDYREFKSSLESKLKTSDLTYEFEDLDYPAVSVSGENMLVGLGALVSGGESYTFGKSVQEGISQLTSIVNSSSCKDTKYVIGGYSQGAMVVSGSLEKLKSERIVYAATFGDPKIFLPEGAGVLPAACKGENLSDYRIYVPDCFAHKGLLGAKEPYTSSSYAGKLGTWCNKYDIFCSSKYSITSHTSYTKDKLYEDASKLIFSKVATEFNFKNDYTSPHDTAILIDSTGSMSDIIADYKNEALKLAEKTLSSGGRVALFDYRDLADGYIPVEKCNFKTCTMESFREGLDTIYADGGGDTPESLLSSSFQVMKSLDWRLGSTKSLVILTDAGYHSPDLDGTTFYDVQTLSKQIDPVNFYIITTDENLDTYQSLAEATDGQVASTADDLSILTNSIMERFDSLPRVEESEEDLGQAPRLSINEIQPISSSEYKVNFTTDADETIVILNEAVLGVTNQHEITFTDLNMTTENTVTLVPIKSNLRGEAVSITLNNTTNQVDTSSAGTDLNASQNIIEPLKFQVPKAPNTGRR